MITKQKIKIIGLKEFRLNMQKYIDLLDKGWCFIVVKRSKPVFKVISFVPDF